MWIQLVVADLKAENFRKMGPQKKPLEEKDICALTNRLTSFYEKKDVKRTKIIIFVYLIIDILLLLLLGTRWSSTMEEVATPADFFDCRMKHWYFF